MKRKKREVRREELDNERERDGRKREKGEGRVWREIERREQRRNWVR